MSRYAVQNLKEAEAFFGNNSYFRQQIRFCRNIRVPFAERAEAIHRLAFELEHSRQMDVKGLRQQAVDMLAKAS